MSRDIASGVIIIARWKTPEQNGAFNGKIATRNG